MRFSALYRELLGRRVFRTLALYVIGAWVVLQVAETLFPGIGLPDWAIRYVLVAVIAGFPLAAIFSWLYQITPSGIVRCGKAGVVDAPQSLRRSDHVILLAFLVVIGFIAYGTISQLSDVPDVEVPAVVPVMSERSVVVLPFRNLDAGEAGDVLATGLTEALNNALVRAPGIDVIARGAALRPKGQDLAIREVGKLLGAAYVVQGTVRLTGDEVHVSAELVDARDGLTRWSDAFDRSAGEILTVHRDIVQQLVLSLGSGPDDAHPALASQTLNAAAFEAYSRGRFFWNQRTSEGLQQARKYFEEALSLDPDYALAWSGLADVFVSMYDYGEMTLAESSPRAKEAIDHALRLDPLLSAAHNSRAHLAMHHWMWTEAQTEFERAVELDPGYAPAYHWYALCLTAIGRLDLAVTAMKKAQSLDPLSSRINADLGMALFAARAYEEAIAQERRTLEINPDSAVAYWVIGMASAGQGDYDEAIAAFEESLLRAPDDPPILGSLGYTYARAGRAEEAQAIITSLEAMDPATTDAFSIALVYAGLDRRPEALSLLERAVKARSGSVRYLKIDARLDNLRGEPRFKALLTEVGL